MIRRGGGGDAPDDTTRRAETELQRLEVAVQRLEQAAADLKVRNDWLEQDNKGLREALYEAERETVAVERERDSFAAWCLPMLEPGTWADDPMPSDARISRKGDGRLCGSWQPVPGDQHDLPPLIGGSDDSGDDTAEATT